MRKLSFLLFSVLLVPMLVNPVWAQITMPLAPEDAPEAQSYPIAGSHLLWKQQQEVAAYMAMHPEMLEQMNREKSVAWDFVVGSQRSWYASDLQSNQFYLVPSTCRAVGNKCYIFVEDASWGSRVTQQVVDSVRVAFDLRVPANPAKGIYQQVVDAFGNAPDVDSDPRIIIAILDIKDGYAGSGGWVIGYYHPINQTTMANSNRAEIYYLDANPTNLSTSSGLVAGLQTMAHEFQHMIHFNYDTNEILFINEGCSLLAEVHCGYPIYEQSYYVNETNHYLLDFRNDDINLGLRDYSRAARYMTYIRDQAGIGAFKPIVQSSLNGLEGLDAGLQAFGTTLRSNDIFRNWAIANILDNRSVNPAYGYIYPNLPKAVGRLHADPNVPLTGRVLQNLGIEYLTFKHGANLRATITAQDPALLIKAVEIGPSSKRVLDVTPGVEFQEPAYGTTYTEVHFVVINTSPSLPMNYFYQASGAVRPVELKWDTTEPLGFLGSLSPSDTVVVTFNAVPGGRLDSVRVALRRAGSITGGVWRYTGVQRPTPLGARLAFPITASISTTPPLPYPVPWPNWAKIDLRSYSISTDAPFAAGFIIGADPATPAVMVTTYPSDSPYNSYTYLHAPSSGPPNWYFIGDGEGNVYIYLIRAYVSFTTGVEETIELAPSSFTLAQNYPNPFNPQTTIEFSIPQAGPVTLKIVNLLGEEVATLISQELPAGKHKVQWDAAGLVSGVYFYRLETGGIVQAKKLLLLK